jgi:hypothetical protein
MIENNWQEHPVVIKIRELKKDYVQRFGFAGTATFGVPHVWSMWHCSACGNLTTHTESFYHKDNNNNSGISLCPNCSDLWRAIGRFDADWFPELLKTYTQEEIFDWLKRNPKPEHFQGSEYMWMYEEAPEKVREVLVRKKKI